MTQVERSTNRQEKLSYVVRYQNIINGKVDGGGYMFIRANSSEEAIREAKQAALTAERTIQITSIEAAFTEQLTHIDFRILLENLSNEEKAIMLSLIANSLTTEESE